MAGHTIGPLGSPRRTGIATRFAPLGDVRALGRGLTVSRLQVHFHLPSEVDIGLARARTGVDIGRIT